LTTGAVDLISPTNGLFAVGYLSAVGIGSQVAITPGTAGLVDTGTTTIHSPTQIAIDNLGNLYVTGYRDGKLWRVLSGSTISYNFSTVSPPPASVAGVAIDNLGVVYVSDPTASRIYSIFLDGTASLVSLSGLTPGLNTPVGLAVDRDANLYIADTGNHRVVKVTAVDGVSVVNTGSYTIGDGMTGVAVDLTGTLYIADFANSRIIKVTPGGDASLLTVSGITPALGAPRGVAVDAAGNLYISDYDNNRIVRVTTTGVASVIPTGGYTLAQPYSVTVDQHGKLYIPDWTNDRIVTVDQSTPADYTFPSTAYGTTSSDSPYVLTVANLSNSNLNLGDMVFATPSSGTNPSLTPSSVSLASASTCPQLSSSSSGATLSAGDQCTYAINFSPQSVGAIDGSFSVTDSGVPSAAPGYASQSLNLHGSGAQASQTISFSLPASVTYGVAPITLSATASSGLPVTFSLVSGPATLSGNTLTITGPGTVVVAADQSGNADYLAASQVIQSVVVNKQSQTISFAVSSPVTYGVSSIALSATASSGLAVSFSVASGPATVSGSSLTITGAGTVSASNALNFNTVARLNGQMVSNLGGGMLASQLPGGGQAVSALEVPVAVRGTASNPQIIPDVAAVASGMARNLARQRLTDALGGKTQGNSPAGQNLQKTLGGLFGRH
jgi:sugar lactone lactonase YvrE